MGKHSLRKPKSRLVQKGMLGVLGAALVQSATVGTAHAAPPEVWDKLAKCESNGNWKINTGNGYYGGLQFTLRTWRAFGGKGMPHQASKSEQIRVAERTLAKQGWNAWPACSRKAGVRKHGSDRERPAAAIVEAAVSTSNGADRTHTVRAGDTLSKIAPENWRDVASKNGIKNPNRIYVGQVIRL